MENKFKRIAQEQVTASVIMIGREAFKTEEVIDKEWTVVQFDFAPKVDMRTRQIVVDPVTGEVDTYGVVVFKEAPQKFYGVGTIFTKICKLWLASCDGDLDAANAELVSGGGVRVKFYEGKTLSGQPVVKVDILE